jgi:hypothetical protein
MGVILSQTFPEFCFQGHNAALFNAKYTDVSEEHVASDLNVEKANKHKEIIRRLKADLFMVEEHCFL